MSEEAPGFRPGPRAPRVTCDVLLRALGRGEGGGAGVRLTSLHLDLFVE